MAGKWIITILLIVPKSQQEKIEEALSTKNIKIVEKSL